MIMDYSVEWPRESSSHAATHLSGPLFVIVGGEDKYYHTQLVDMWLCNTEGVSSRRAARYALGNTTTKLWKKVLFLITVL